MLMHAGPHPRLDLEAIRAQDDLLVVQNMSRVDREREPQRKYLKAREWQDHPGTRPRKSPGNHQRHRSHRTEHRSQLPRPQGTVWAAQPLLPASLCDVNP